MKDAGANFLFYFFIMHTSYYTEQRLRQFKMFSVCHTKEPAHYSILQCVGVCSQDVCVRVCVCACVFEREKGCE